jgi:hypothetical protein
MSTPQTAIDTDSIAAFGVQSTAMDWPHSDLLLINDVDVHALVTEVCSQCANDFIGISSIEVDADQEARLYHTLSKMASTGIGTAATFDVRWAHPSGEIYDESVRVIGFNFNLTMEGEQAKFTGNVRTARNMAFS